MTRWGFILFVFGLSVAPIRVPAQTTTATILGSITDSSGASVANANITVRHVDTGWTRTVTSDDSGGYFVPQLPVGDYEALVQVTSTNAANSPQALLVELHVVAPSCF